MGRFYGKVGYADIEDKGYGVWIDRVVEREYYGDTIKLSSKWQNASSLNDNLSLNYQISIIADPYALDNFSKIKYVEAMDVRWKVISAEPSYPRIVLTLGELYNGEIPEDRQ